MELQLSRRQMFAPPNGIDWSSVIEDNHEWIGRLVVARIGRQDAVDDVIQEVGLAAARSNARPTSLAEVAPWLCKIVVRQCALFVRNQVRHQRKLAGFSRTASAQDTESGDPIYWLLHEERREIVRRELGAMEAQARQLLVWKYVNGLSYQEIAARLKVTAHVAEYRVIEARKALRRRLQARGIEGGESP